MRPRPPTLATVASALSVLLLAVAACSGGSSRKLIPPPPTTVALLTTGPPGEDFAGVALAPVEGRLPTEPVEILGGDAVLSGRVIGPDGPVPGATVRLERFVGDAMARLDVTSNADGTWRAPQLGPPTTVPPTVATVPGQLPTIPPPTLAPRPPPTAAPGAAPGIYGGRYRVRAWRSPDQALTAPQILFVEGKQNRQLTLQLSRYTGTSVSSISSPDPPVLDGFVNVTAVVTTVAVDAEGVVRSAPLPNATLSLSVGSGWAFTSGPQFTNGQGRATFVLRCQALGQSPIDLTVNGSQTFALPVRACVAPAPTTTTTLSNDPFGGGTSTSQGPGQGGATTSIGGTPTT